MTKTFIESFEQNVTLGVFDVGKSTLARLQEEDFLNIDLLMRKLNNQIDALLKRAQTIRVGSDIFKILDLLISFAISLDQVKSKTTFLD